MAESPVRLIVGLGNPGTKYQPTRHNAGFWFLDELARQCGATFKDEKKYAGEWASANISGAEIKLLKPMTFMNVSGQSVQTLANFYKIPAEEILVAHDELDLPCGTARLKRGGGHGGHNGLRDIVQKLGSKNFLRLRIGIDHPGHKDDVSNYVLSKPSPDQRISIERSIDDALSVMDDVVKGNLEQAMHRLHTQ